ncbi:MAG: hypothetical protein U9N72_02605 [Bacteroidota bacterium]|nr:hypothetical protein [Bacteroidota bacterium]
MRLILSLIIFTSLPLILFSQDHDNFQWHEGAIIRGDTRTKEIALVFTGDEYADGDMTNYRNSEEIYHNILDYESKSENGLNGFILLVHIGSSPMRTDKFYYLLDDLIEELTSRGYRFCRIDTLIRDHTSCQE